MIYKKMTLAMAVAGMLLTANMCGATVPEEAEAAPPAVKAKTAAQLPVTTGKKKAALPARSRDTSSDVRIYTEEGRLRAAVIKPTQNNTDIAKNTKPAPKTTDVSKNVKPTQKNTAAASNAKSAKAAAQAAPKTAAQAGAAKGKYTFAGITLPDDYRSISIFGDPVASKAQAVALIKTNNPDVKLSCSVEKLVDLYWEEAGRENVRPDLALAQSIVETGSYRYGGDVQHNQNNFCGLGTTGGGVKGATFKTPQLGVRAHIQHLLAYTQKKRPSTAIVDPRYELAHNIRLERGMVDTWYGLNGTWAMGAQYCEKIMASYQRMLAQQVSAEEAEEDKRSEKERQKAEKQAQKEAQRQHKMRERVAKILRDSK